MAISKFHEPRSCGQQTQGCWAESLLAVLQSEPQREAARTTLSLDGSEESIERAASAAEPLRQVVDGRSPACHVLRNSYEDLLLNNP